MITISRTTLAVTLCLSVISVSALQTPQQSQQSQTYIASLKSAAQQFSSAATRQFSQIISKASHSLGTKNGIIAATIAAVTALTGITFGVSPMRQQATNGICSHASHAILKLSNYVKSPRLILLGLRLALGKTREYEMLQFNVMNPTSDGLKRMSPLHIAALHNYVDIAKLLLKAGANTEIQTTDADKWTPLQIAIIRHQPEMVNTLLNAGANKEQRDSAQKTPLMLAVLSGHTDTIATLVKAGADKSAKDGEGKDITYYVNKSVNQEGREKLLAALLLKLTPDPVK